MSSSELSTSAYLCGDLVIHPSRPWPWLGTVHPKLRNNCRLCSNCGEMRLNLFDEFNNVSGKAELICDSCGEVPMKVVDTLNCYAGDSFGEQDDRFVTRFEPSNNKFSPKDISDLSEAPLNSAASIPSGSFRPFSSVETEKSVNTLWHATWFPVGEVSELDGTEVVILPFKQRSMFQEGSPVSKKDNSVVGLVKQVHRKIDVFVLPDYKTVICDLPSDRLLPISHMEQAPGCYVIYKGWVGTVFNVYNRIHFRLNDGSEFFVNDEENERISVHVTEIDRKVCAACNLLLSLFKKKQFLSDRQLIFICPYDEMCNFESNQFYPCQVVKLRLCLLEKAVWSDGRTEIGDDLKEKIEKSRRSYTTIRNLPRRLSVDELDVALEKCTAAAFNGVQDSAMYQEAVQKFSNILKKSNIVAGQVGTASENNSSEPKSGQLNNDTVSDDEEWTSATVVKIEPIKIEVEWISQVVSDPMLSEPSMKANYIERDEIKNLTTFRACRAYESFDLGVRYTCHMTDEDRQISAERWRCEMFKQHQHQQQPPFLHEVQSEDTAACSTNPLDRVMYVSVARSTTKIDVLWENGVFETDLDPSELSAQYAHPVDRDYFPAMYVLLQGASGSTTTNLEIASVGGEEPDVFKLSKSQQSNSVASVGATTTLNLRYKNVLPNRFGVVRKARNSEKYATVDWYDFDPIQFQDSQTEDDVQPTFVKTEDVSFYDLKFYHDFNYVGGSLVSRVKPQNQWAPNVGYIRRKNPDGTVLVIWYDGREETTFPWKLKQLNNRMFYSEYSASDAENDHYYSPTEHEYEDLEDFRYYDYASLSESQRNKRVALIVTLLQEVIPRLVRAIVIAFKHFSSLDRKKFVKLTLSTNDVTNGFAQMPDFRECLKDIYDVELELTKTHKSNRKNSFREEKLVWQCANWLYDWTEVMSTLHEDIRKDHYKTITMINNPIYSNHVSKSEAKRSKMEPTPIVIDSTMNETFDSTVYNNESSSVEESPEGESLIPMETDDPLAVEMMDLLRSIETGLSTVTGILAVPSSSDVTTCVILEYINNCRKENSANPPAMDNNNVQYADLITSHAFLLKLVSNSGKTSRLPCFSFAHRSDQDLSDLGPKWNVQSFKNGRLKRDDVEKKIENNESDVTPQAAVERVLSLVESVLEGNRDLSCREDDILSICNEIADGLCLSVLSILNSIVNRVGSHLSSEVAKLFETTNASDSTKISAEDQGAEFVEDMETHPACTTSAAAAAADDLNCTINVHHGCFEILPNAPMSHRFINKSLNGQNVPKSFFSAVRREIKLLQTSLPPGIFIKTYEDRMDLFSCMIVGPQGTPYADGLFFFDVRLREDYPNRPPHAFFKSMSKLLNPNLYEDGMVCLSLLGTWDGKEVELWSPSSTLLQVFVSIQSLILVSEPYFNEPGYEKEKGTTTGATKSRDYNESAVLRTLESLKRILGSPPEPFLKDILRHVKENGSRLIKLLEIYQETDCDNSILSFPLFPVTQGFCLCIKRHSSTLLEAMQKFVIQWDGDSSSSSSSKCTENIGSNL